MLTWTVIRRGWELEGATINCVESNRLKSTNSTQNQWAYPMVKVGAIACTVQQLFRRSIYSLVECILRNRINRNTMDKGQAIAAGQYRATGNHKRTRCVVPRKPPTVKVNRDRSPERVE
ncbi:hypothetical protein KIN20_005302 [Parelaphostrongylus tenuis]|uniref:Uncharacterized protein n=1 Tax=Parelaphostrongylus tenuis TaxID=148309 RepID=A0AAD5MI81_PARTN|nr:hypothetical protein KIN20_005302 [Parelaphostrongylus tenuis]